MENVNIIDFSIYRGDDEQVTFENVGEGIDLTRAKIALWALPRRGSALKLSTADGTISTTNNKITLHLSHELTKNLKWETAEYDLQIYLNGKYKTVIKGTITLEHDVTKEEYEDGLNA